MTDHGTQESPLRGSRFPEDQIVCACTHQDFEPANYARASAAARAGTIDWSLVPALAIGHQVAPLVYTNLKHCLQAGMEVPHPVLQTLKQNQWRNIFVKRKVQSNLEKALHFLAQRDIDVMLLNGEALNRTVYRQPWYTVSGDIDILFRQTPDEMGLDQHAEVVAYLERLGKGADAFNTHFEYDYGTHHDVNMSGVVAVNFERCWQSATTIVIGSQPVTIMSPEDRLIAAAVNACRKRFFVLKHMCNVAETARQLTDASWRLVVDRADEFGCGNILYTALLVAQLYLDLPVPTRYVDQLIPSTAKRWFLQRAVSHLQGRYSIIALNSPLNIPLLHRTVTPGLVLTYATYSPRQLVRKLREIEHADASERAMGAKPWEQMPPPRGPYRQ